MEKSSSFESFYNILGVGKESSTAEIRTAYRKLAMRWHPDKCCKEKGDAREEAKLKFQAVQEAYSVLSDGNRRVVYDAGLHEEVENDPSMQDFMGELVNLMNRGSPVPSKESNPDAEFEELRKQFMNMVDTNNYVQDCHKFDSSESVSNFEEFLTPFSPTQHANLYTTDCPQFDLSSEYLDDICRSFWQEGARPAATDPQPRPSVSECQSFAFNPLSKGSCQSNSEPDVGSTAFVFEGCRGSKSTTHSSPGSREKPIAQGFCIGNKDTDPDKRRR